MKKFIFILFLSFFLQKDNLSASIEILNSENIDKKIFFKNIRSIDIPLLDISKIPPSEFKNINKNKIKKLSDIQLNDISVKQLVVLTKKQIGRFSIKQLLTIGNKAKNWNRDQMSGLTGSQIIGLSKNGAIFNNLNIGLLNIWQLKHLSSFDIIAENHTSFSKETILYFAEKYNIYECCKLRDIVNFQKNQIAYNEANRNTVALLNKYPELLVKKIKKLSQLECSNLIYDEMNLIGDHITELTNKQLYFIYLPFLLLNKKQIEKLDDRIKYFNNFHVKTDQLKSNSFTENQIGSLSIEQIEKLEYYVFNQLGKGTTLWNREQIGAIKPKVIENAEEQIKYFTVLQLNLFNQKQFYAIPLRHLTKKQVQEFLTKNHIQDFNTDKINRIISNLSSKQIGFLGLLTVIPFINIDRIDPKAIKGFQKMQIQSLNGGQIKKFSIEQIEEFTGYQMEEFRIDQLKDFTKTQIQSLKVDQFIHFSRDKLTYLYLSNFLDDSQKILFNIRNKQLRNRLANLNEETIKKLTDAKIEESLRYFPAELIQFIPKNKIKSIPPILLSKLDEFQINNFTKEQVEEFTIEQIYNANFDKTRIQYFAKHQIEQFNQYMIEVFIIYFSPVQISYIPLFKVNLIGEGHQGVLEYDSENNIYFNKKIFIFPKLNDAQIEGFTDQQAQQFTNNQLEALKKNNQIKYFNNLNKEQKRFLDSL